MKIQFWIWGKNDVLVSPLTCTLQSTNKSLGSLIYYGVQTLEG